MERSYKIAGVTVNMDTFGKALAHAIAYQVEYTDQPDIRVVGDRKAFQEKYPWCNDDFCEYTSTAMDFYNKIYQFDGMLIHSSAVVIDGKAYLFTADSGTGKSTHTSLYRCAFGDERVRILNDDKPVVRLEDGVFYAYGTPWSGKTDMHLNLRVPLAGVCVLHRGEKNEIEPFKGQEALFALLAQTLRPYDETYAEKMMDLLTELLEKVPVWTMKCNMDPEAARVSYAAMSGTRKEG